MKIGIIGGTGGMGKGFAYRWCSNHDILIGSRDSSRATSVADEYGRAAKEMFGDICDISGNTNDYVAKNSDVLVLSIPYENIDAVCSEILGGIRDDCLVISPIVPMIKTDIGFEFIPFKENKPSAHKMIEKYMKNVSKLVSAFHVISEKKLADPNIELNYDIFVCGDKSNLDVINGLINEIKGLRSIYLGTGDLAYMAEVSTPLLLNAMIRNKMKNPGIKII